MKKTPTQEPPMSENEKLRRLLYRWATWCQRAMADDDNDYLNGRGWDDAEDLTSGTFAALSTPCVEQDADEVERVAFAIIEGSAGLRAAQHAKEFQTANWSDALRSSHAALSAIQSRDAGLREAIEKVRDGYRSQMKFCDIEALGYFREFVRRIDAALQMGGEKP